MSVARSYRLPAGGQIDRSKPRSFRCNGRAYSGYAGDTLASALLANGVRIVGRSFKYHRPRGIFAAGIEETNALFRVDAGGLSVPLVRATLQPLLDGLVATTENAWPGVGFDIGRVLDFTHWLWPAGFYNKTFKWPNWHWYEPLIRRSAGSGRVPVDTDPSDYFQHNLHCDVLVVGGGPAGLCAALTAGRAGARVVLAELEPQLGGRLHFEERLIAQAPAAQWLRAAVEELQSLPNVRLLRETMVAGAFDHSVFVAVDRSRVFDAKNAVERLWKLRARQVVLATGAVEQPLVFANNDCPGVMLAGAVRRYAHQFAVAAGHNIAIATNNDDAYRTAFTLQDAGIRVPVLVDARPSASPGVAAEATRRGLDVMTTASVVAAAGARGLKAIRIGRADPAATGRLRTVACDALGVSAGWCPTVHLYSQARGSLRYDEAIACFVPSGELNGWHAAGAANGCFALDATLRQGAEAGAAAARALGLRPDVVVPFVEPEEGCSIRPVRAPAGDTSRQWLDLRHDATVADIELAVRENYSSAEHAKRYTTVGMSVDQGKTSNLNASRVLAQLTDRGLAELGTTTFRPFYSPVSMGAIAAGNERALYSPTRRLPADRWHREAGANFDEYGGWQRPAYYPQAAESRSAAITREVRATRTSVGLFDGSPLGKIEVKGPDAAEFLHRIYLNSIHTLAPGRVRYGLMLNENGIVIDDGVVAHMAPGHYLVCPTSGGAERIAAWLDEWHQCEWPRLRLVISPVTTQWGVCTVAGPHARDVLQALPSNVDFSREALPHLGFATGTVAGLPARVQRVSFTGEASYEISVPARSTSRLFEALMDAGRRYDIAAFGVEALLVMRTEKGFIHVGVDSDGTTNPFDLGLGAIVERKQDDFVGRRSLQRAHDRHPGRRQLVGLEPLNPHQAMVAGSHLVTRAAEGKRRSEGFVTSACWSPTLSRSIGLGLLERGFARLGDTVVVFDAGREFEARIAAPAFYDPTGERMRG